YRYTISDYALVSPILVHSAMPLAVRVCAADMARLTASTSADAAITGGQRGFAQSLSQVAAMVATTCLTVAPDEGGTCR
ncbi:MAG: hypothetical protein KJ749_04805, partial [Planctomycetes bacterium]|nr:hypothetical protein [Planctomycetota bacterium]